VNANARDIVAAKKLAAGDVTTKARRAFEKEPLCGKVRSECNRRPKTTNHERERAVAAAAHKHRPHRKVIRKAENIGV
jgi:hypothetical protein